MTPPIANYRRIEHLKTHAYSLGLTNDEVKKFGKLSKTSTWEAACNAYCVDCPGCKNELEDSCECVDRIFSPNPLDTVLDNTLDNVNNTVDSTVDTFDWVNDGSFPVCFSRQTSTSFLDWVDFGQLVVVLLASMGVFVMAMSMWRQINPLNLFPPIKINIQIGAKL